MEESRSASLLRPASSRAIIRGVYEASSGLLSSASLDDEENRCVSQARDIVDRAIESSRFSNCGSIHSFVDEDVHVIGVENEGTQLQSLGRSTLPFGSADSSSSLKMTSSIPADAVSLSIDTNQDVKKQLPPSLDYISCLLHLSVCGIFGVMTRYLLQNLFGPEVARASMMAALATVRAAVNSRNCDTVANGLQFGLLGCVSTVSTLIAKFHAMRQSSQPWRAYAYAALTIIPSLS